MHTCDLKSQLTSCFREKWAVIVLFLLVVVDISTSVMSCIETDFDELEAKFEKFLSNPRRRPVLSQERACRVWSFKTFDEFSD